MPWIEAGLSVPLLDKYLPGVCFPPLSSSSRRSERITGSVGSSALFFFLSASAVGSCKCCRCHTRRYLSERNETDGQRHFLPFCLFVVRMRPRYTSRSWRCRYVLYTFPPSLRLVVAPRPRLSHRCRAHQMETQKKDKEKATSLCTSPSAEAMDERDGDCNRSSTSAPTSSPCRSPGAAGSFVLFLHIH